MCVFVFARASMCALMRVTCVCVCAHMHACACKCAHTPFVCMQVHAHDVCLCMRMSSWGHDLCEVGLQGCMTARCSLSGFADTLSHCKRRFVFLY